MSKVSVLIPCLNAARWVADTIASVRSQTYRRVEMIIVDDGSTDGRRAVLQRLNGPDMKVLTQDHLGAGVARNRALEHSQGDYIQFLDADDLLGPTKISDQLVALADCSANTLALCPVVYFNDGQSRDAGVRHQGWPFVDSIDPVNWLVELLGPDKGSMVPLHCWLSPRSVISRVGAWNPVRSPIDDGEFFARVVLESDGIKNCTDALCFYRKHPRGGSLSGRRDAMHRSGHLQHLNSIESHLLSRIDSSRARRALARIYFDFAVNAYPSQVKLSRTAMQKVRELGGAARPRFGSVASETLARLVGWRGCRLAQELSRPIMSRVRARRHEKIATTR